MKTLKNQMCLLCFEDLEVLERALVVLGGSCGGPWGLWGVPGRSLRGPWGSLGAPGGSLWGPCGPHTRKRQIDHCFCTFPRRLGAPCSFLGGFLVSLGAPLEVPGEALGGPRGCSTCLLESLRVLGWPLWTHWGLMKSLTNHRFLLCFEHLDVLGSALGILLGPWGCFGWPWRFLRGPWGSLEGPSGILGGAIL